MASGIVKIEGKEISLDQQIIDAGIPAIKAALSVDFPDVENADVEIVTPGGGAPRVATVVKRGTGKGTVELTSSRSLPTVKGGDAKTHLGRNAQDTVDSLFRRLDATSRVQMVLNLARTTCACGSAEPHPDNYWIVLIGGPFKTNEDAINALSDVAQTKPDILRNDEALRRPPLTGNDITGGQS